MLNIPKQNDDVKGYIPAGMYKFNVNNGNTRTMCEICSVSTIKIS